MNQQDTKTRRRLAALGLFLFLSMFAPVANAAQVLIPLATGDTMPATNRFFTLTPLALSPQGYVPLMDKVYGETYIDGNATNTLFPGLWQCDVKPQWGGVGQSEFFFYVDPSNAVQDAFSNLLTTVDNTYPGPQYAYPAAASDARYIVGPVTSNDVANINPSQIYPPVSGGSGGNASFATNALSAVYAGTATNAISATNSQFATSAGSASMATNAQTAGTATNAGSLSQGIGFPNYDLIGPTSMRITNGPVVSFASCWAMWEYMATNPLDSQFTNAPYFYPYGADIKVENGVNLLTNNVAFNCPTNWPWSWSLEGANPMLASIQAACTNIAQEGLVFFGVRNTNSLSSQVLYNGWFSISGIGLWAPNQSNDTLYVVGAQQAKMINCVGGLTNAFTSAGTVPYDFPSGQWNLTVARFQSHFDNGLTVADCNFYGGQYAVVGDMDHVKYDTITTGGFYGNGHTNGAGILDRSYLDTSVAVHHYVSSDYGYIRASSIYSGNGNPQVTLGAGDFADSPITYNSVAILCGGTFSITYPMGGGFSVMEAPGIGVNINFFALSGYVGRVNNIPGILLGSTNTEVDTGNNILDDGNGDLTAKNTVTATGISGGSLTTNYNSFSVYRQQSASVPNLVAQYTYAGICALGLPFFTNNLPSPANSNVDILFSATYTDPWNHVTTHCILPTNEIVSGVALTNFVNASSLYAFEPNFSNGSTNVGNGSWEDAVENVNDILSATNITFYPVVINNSGVTVNAGKVYSPQLLITQASTNEIGLADTNGRGENIYIYASTNSGVPTLYLHGSGNVKILGSRDYTVMLRIICVCVVLAVLFSGIHAIWYVRRHVKKHLNK